MSYEYKTILRRENHDFDYYKNRWNSRTSGVLAINKSGEATNVAMINNNTGTIFITDEATAIFSKKTIQALKTKLS